MVKTTVAKGVNTLSVVVECVDEADLHLLISMMREIVKAPGLSSTTRIFAANIRNHAAHALPSYVNIPINVNDEVQNYTPHADLDEIHKASEEGAKHLKDLEDFSKDCQQRDDTHG